MENITRDRWPTIVQSYKPTAQRVQENKGNEDKKYTSMLKELRYSSLQHDRRMLYKTYTLETIFPLDTKYREI
jgi:hypothetical protein